jgi:hypothetical protein
MKLKELRPAEYIAVPMKERAVKYLECAACGLTMGDFRMPPLGVWHNAQYYSGWRYWPAMKVVLCGTCAEKSEAELRALVEASANE